MNNWKQTPEGENYKISPDTRGYPCPACKQLFNTNPEEPPPPHTKPNSDEFCLSPEQWRREIELCP